MSHSKDLLFPIPVFRILLEEHELLNVYLKSRLYSWRQRQRGGSRERIPHKGNWQSPGNMHEMSEFRVLSDQIQAWADELLHSPGEVGAVKNWCTEMRSNISDRFGHEQPLTSEEPDWRGIYYVQAPENCGGLVFHKPESEGGSPFGKAPHENEVYAAIEGQIIFFPSWLPYSIEPNQSLKSGDGGDRISIEFSFCTNATQTTKP